MTDLLTHVLVAYVAATVLSWFYEQVTDPMVVAGMVGALIPDMKGLGRLVSEMMISTVFDVPFSWIAFARLGGALLVVLIIVALVPRGYRGITVVMLSLGVFSHFFLDAFLFQGDGLSFGMFWPVTSYRLPIEGFYLSSDRWPLAFALVLAIGAWLGSRYPGSTAD